MTGRISRYFRSRRLERFALAMQVTPETRVLDVGGTPETWDGMAQRPRVTLLNTPRTREEMSGADEWVAGDGRALPFRDGAFDIVFSNSVIEHVGAWGDQERFAREVRRVGRRYWVQTPNRWFPVEQHLLTPLVHWLPRKWQRLIVPRFTVWSWVSGATEDRRRFYLEHYLSEVRLLTGTEVRTLFPGATVVRERAIGWTKSFVAVGITRE